MSHFSEDEVTKCNKLWIRIRRIWALISSLPHSFNNYLLSFLCTKHCPSCWKETGDMVFGGWEDETATSLKCIFSETFYVGLSPTQSKVQNIPCSPLHMWAKILKNKPVTSYQKTKKKCFVCQSHSKYCFVKLGFITAKPKVKEIMLL